MMASMFQEDFVLGLASGPLITHANSRLASRIWCLKSYSYNQEVNADFLGEAQGVVHRATAALGCFERLRRDESWVRRGYVEEIYVPGKNPDTHIGSGDGGLQARR